MTSAAFQRFHRHQHGSVLMVVGVWFLVLVAVGGMGYDLGRQQMVRLKLQQASDAAALAGALVPAPATDDDRRAEANRYFQLNFPDNYLSVARPLPTIEVTSEYVKVSANSTIRTHFVTNIGVERLPTKGASKVLIQVDNKPPIDLILVMDNSNSMRLEDVGSGSTMNVPPNLRSTARNAAISRCIQYYRSLGYVGPIYNPIVTATCNSTPNQTYWNPTPPPGRYQTAYALEGPNRLNALRFSADRIASNLLNPNTYNNRIAVVRWESVLLQSTPFDDNYTNVRRILELMFAWGDTNSTLGLQAALTTSNTMRQNAARAVVLLTDGLNSDPVLTNSAINNASLAICRQLKDAQIEVYTIAFGQDVRTNATVASFLSECASGTRNQNLGLYFFVAPDAATLNTTFQNILKNLEKVRIAE